MRHDLDITLKLLLVLTGFMASMVLYVVCVVAMPRSAPVTAVAAAACDASTFEGAARCAAGSVCLHDRCVPAPEDAACAPGESCRGCECEAPLVCHRNRCEDPRQLDRLPLECKRNRRLADAVRYLADRCGARRKQLQDVAEDRRCTAADWEQLALDDPRFDLILAAFPGRFSLHFPVGRPYISRAPWPPRAQHEFYREQLRAHRDALRGAKQIFVIGRASPDGAAEVNHTLAVLRMDLVTRLIGEVIHEGVAPTEQTIVPIYAWALRDEKPVEPASFARTYLDLRAGATAPVIAWNDETQRELRRLLGGAIDLDQRGSPQWTWLYNAINRGVLVIPIPCDGREFDPTQNILEAPQARG